MINIRPRHIFVGAVGVWSIYAGITAGQYWYGKPHSTSRSGSQPVNVSHCLFDVLAPRYDAAIRSEEFWMGLGFLRKWILKHAKGDVLEISAGTGRTLPYYTYEGIRSLTLTDLSQPMLQLAEEKYFEELNMGQRHPGTRIAFYIGDAHCMAADDQHAPFVQSLVATVKAQQQSILQPELQHQSTQQPIDTPAADKVRSTAFRIFRFGKPPRPPADVPSLPAGPTAPSSSQTGSQAPLQASSMSPASGHGKQVAACSSSSSSTNRNVHDEDYDVTASLNSKIVGNVGSPTQHGVDTSSKPALMPPVLTGPGGTAWNFVRVFTGGIPSKSASQPQQPTSDPSTASPSNNPAALSGHDHLSTTNALGCQQQGSVAAPRREDSHVPAAAKASAASTTAAEASSSHPCACQSRSESLNEGFQQRCQRGKTQRGAPLARFPAASFDTVVDSFGLCSHEDPVQVLQQAARVCKPDGKIILLEHGKASYQWLNNYLDGGADDHQRNWGCRWNRDILALVEQAGLVVESTSRWHFGTTYMVVARPS